MQTRESSDHAPVVAAFSPRTAAREAVEFGLAASRVLGAPLVVVAVVDAGKGSPEALRELGHELEQADVFAELREIEDSTATRGLARAIDELQPQLIVIGSTSRGPKGAMLLGTTAERVLHVSAIPVAVIPNGYKRPAGGVRRIGAAYVESPEGEQALRGAAHLARLGGVELRVLSAADPHELAEREPQLRAQIAPYIEGLSTEIVVVPDEAAAALTAASADVDLLVMGSRGLGPLRAVVLGSVSRRVIDRAACPVLVIPRGDDDPPASAVTPVARPHLAGW